MSVAEQEKTGLGNYFVANYPPFSVLEARLTCPTPTPPCDAPPEPGTPLGLYLHIPFCRKRCKFCYFRVYTDKNARDVETYLDALVKEVELYSRLPVVGGRPLHFVYFGGGTPSYLSADAAAQPDDAPASSPALGPAPRRSPSSASRARLQQHKLETLQRARRHPAEPRHRELRRRRSSSPTAGPTSPRRSTAPTAGPATLGFDQINIDLIAGMVGETWDNWRDCVRKTIELAPDSVTIYQMELPFNTVFSQGAAGRRPGRAGAMADRRLADQAGLGRLRLRRDGRGRLRGLQRLHAGQGPGAAASSSTATASGTGPTCSAPASPRSATSAASTCRTSIPGSSTSAMLDQGELPLGRALPVTPRRAADPRDDPAAEDRPAGRRLLPPQVRRRHPERLRRRLGRRWPSAGFLTIHDDGVELTPDGLLQVDRLLPAFFEPEHRGTRYT